MPSGWATGYLKLVKTLSAHSGHKKHIC